MTGAGGQRWLRGLIDRPADFFVSYTSADPAWAEWISWQLEARATK
jgi:hypothetical protein